MNGVKKTQFRLTQASYFDFTYKVNFQKSHQRNWIRSCFRKDGYLRCKFVFGKIRPSKKSLEITTNEVKVL